MSKKYYLLTAVLGVLVTTALVAGLASAAELENRFGQRDNEAAQTALEAGDYSAWLEAVGDGPIAEQITADNFAKFAEAHQLMQDGDHEAAKAIMDELGLQGHGPKGQRQNQNSNNQ